MKGLRFMTYRDYQLSLAAHMAAQQGGRRENILLALRAVP